MADNVDFVDDFVYPNGADSFDDEEGSEGFAPASEILSHPLSVPDEFDSLEDLRVASRSQAASHGFAISTSRSHMTKGWGFLGCSLGGAHRTAMGQDYELVRKRPVQSRRDGCPFKDRTWGVDQTNRWTFTTSVNIHNHPPGDTLTLSSLRKLTFTRDVEEFVFCSMPMPINPFKHLRADRQRLCILGGKLAEWRQLSSQQTETFCAIHEGETSVIPLGLRDGFDVSVDFLKIPERLVVVWIGEELAMIADQLLRSSMFQEVQRVIDDVGKSRWKKPGERNEQHRDARMVSS